MRFKICRCWIGGTNWVFFFCIFSFLLEETGWPITAHAVGLRSPAVEHLQTTGKPVPGFNGKKNSHISNLHLFIINMTSD